MRFDWFSLYKRARLLQQGRSASESALQKNNFCKVFHKNSRVFEADIVYHKSHNHYGGVRMSGQLALNEGVFQKGGKIANRAKGG